MRKVVAVLAVVLAGLYAGRPATVQAQGALPSVGEAQTAAPVQAQPLQRGSCGDGQCNPPEDCRSCSSDCGSCCGNHRCDNGEDCRSCSQDCGNCR